MKPKGLLIGVGLLAVLGGLIWWSNKKQAATSTDTTVKILSIPEGDFQRIRIKKLTNEVIELRRDGGKWALTSPKPQAADQDAVASTVATLSALNADKVADEKAADLHAFGLDVPTLDVTVTKKDGKTAELLVGDSTLDSSGSYAKLIGDPRVFTIASASKTSLDKNPEDLRDKRLLSFDSEKLTRVELQAKGQTLEFGKNGQNEWQMVKPRPLRADSSAVTTLVDKLRDAKLDTSELPEEAAKKFAAAAKVGTASATDASGTQTLEIRKDKDNNYYAKSTATEGVWKTSADTGGALDKGLDDFRNKKIFDFGFSDPSRVELKAAAFTKAGDKWMSGQKTMDNISVQALIDKLRDLSATRFPEKGGGGDTVFEATVVSGEGKRIEKVVITKQGSQDFAKREGDASIYELDPQAVADLQKAAADVKEAPPEKKK